MGILKAKDTYNKKLDKEVYDLLEKFIDDQERIVEDIKKYL